MIIEEPLEYACRAFLVMMRRESVIRYPDREHHTVPDWSLMSMADRITIAKSISAAIAVHQKILVEAANSQATTEVSSATMTL